MSESAWLSWSEWLLWVSIVLCILTVPFSIWTIAVALERAKRPPPPTD